MPSGDGFTPTKRCPWGWSGGCATRKFCCLKPADMPNPCLQANFKLDGSQAPRGSNRSVLRSPQRPVRGSPHFADLYGRSGHRRSLSGLHRPPRNLTYCLAGQVKSGFTVGFEAAMIARNVRRQRPQSLPAPQAAAISLDVVAPRATTSHTVWLVAPAHRQTYISKVPDRR